MSKQVIQFKITLNNSEPKIWRRIQVPEDYTFWDLHCAMQNAMGWVDGHLHGFSITKTTDGTHQMTNIQMPNPEWDNEGDKDESKERLMDWFPKQMKQCIYTYDFGDGWDHAVLFERCVPMESGKKYPICTAGKNACPPEDCGGLGGYDRLLKAISDPKHEEHIELRKWIGLAENEKFNPSEFILKDVIFENPKPRLKEYLEHQDW